MRKVASAVEVTANRKVGPVSVTLAAQGSCPTRCPFLKSGCYAESGPQGIHTARLNKASRKATALDIAKAEASAIDSLSGARPLRLHVVGDCRTNGAARIVASAVTRYHAKHGQRAWTYTHAWRDVARASWGPTSVLASCETVDQTRDAIASGYAAALVVDTRSALWPQDGKAYMAEDVRVIPCPEQTGRAASCADCRLCWDDGALRARRAVIAFGAHGSGSKKVVAALTTSCGKDR